jgi:SAM-dependent methyltransferase
MHVEKESQRLSKQYMIVCQEHANAGCVCRSAKAQRSLSLRARSGQLLIARPSFLSAVNLADKDGDRAIIGNGVVTETKKSVHTSVYTQPNRYERHSSGLRGDVDYYRLLAGRCGGPVLDLGCGTGRMALAIARAGIATIGVDREAAMLRVAVERGGGVASVDWIQADMRRFSLKQRFPLIFAAYRGLQHLLDDVDLASCLRCVYEHLAQDGIFAFDIANPASLRLGPQSGSAVRTHPDRGLTLRYIFVGEMRAQLAAAGFSVDSIGGGFDSRPLDDECGEMVWLARRSAAG